jgi:Integrase zinc binding domain
VESILHFRRVLLGKPFIVFTDHSALERWFLKDPLTEKHAQLMTKLQDFQFTIKFIAGKENVLADFASRPPNNGLSTFDELRRELDEKAVHAVIRVDLKTIIKNHADKDFVERDIRIKKKRVTLKDDIFWYQPKQKDKPVMLIPPGLRKTLIADVHNLGHIGSKRVCRELRANTFWPGMYKDIEHFVNSCKKCLQYKLRPPIAYPSFHIRCTDRWKILHMDIVGPLQMSNNKNEYILTMIDRFSRWVSLTPMSSITSYDVAKALYTK